MRVLFCSIAFPPKSDPECLQTAKYFKYLSLDKELVLDVLTSSIPTLFMNEDNSLNKYDIGWNEKYEVDIPENKYLNYILRKVFPVGIDFPDSKFLFHLRWKSAVRKIKNAPHVIYSRSFPLSSTILAYRLKQYYRIPWIMHLSDPWLLSPLHRFNKKQFNWHQKWERICFESADKICLTSKNTIELYTSFYPEFGKKFDLFPNVYDPADISENPFQFNVKLRFVYTGGLIGERSVKWLRPVFELLIRKFPSLVHDIEFIFAGEMDSINKDQFNKLRYPFVKHVGTLTYDKALSLQKSAHVLINIDNPISDPKNAVFFPSKLLDYFIAKRRIICLTSGGSASQEVLKNYLSDLCENKKYRDLVNYIIRAHSEWKHQNKSYFVVEKLPEVYNAERNAIRLASLLKKV